MNLHGKMCQELVAELCIVVVVQYIGAFAPCVSVVV